MLFVPVKSPLASESAALTQKAHQFLVDTYSPTAPLAETKVWVKPVAPELDKRHCNSPIAFNHTPGRGSRVSLKAVCMQPRWAIYISATIEQWLPLAVTSRALTKGTILGDADLYLKPFDIRRLNAPYFTDPGELVGRSMRRSISANQVITPSQVDKRLLIRKGDLVYIEASKGNMTIRMTGTAQRDGSLGEQVPVINTRSGKTVHGYVKSQGVVSVSPH